ncbi:hypothetical protein DNTS_002191 [Danionella cerebrum]|uniref:Dual specificity protein phosphatase 23 n=1 Tax=Danionella cerebrum TaxID=2873325 RepID=A0A553QAF1_9TELE|nr:hypothetical protein DNTS_002191 [Danionella translucida]
MSSGHELPPNFSWVEPHKLAGLACPSRPSHYRFLLENGVKHLVCLLETLPPGYESFPELQLHHISIVDFTPPTLHQILRFLNIVEEANARGEAVAVHCMHGLGRTGTMLACYLLKTRKLSGQEALRETRRLREGSIETREQEEAVLNFWKHLQSCSQKQNA